MFVEVQSKNNTLCTCTEYQNTFLIVLKHRDPVGTWT
jgi:hypothetical protein